MFASIVNINGFLQIRTLPHLSVSVFRIFEKRADQFP